MLHYQELSAAVRAAITAAQTAGFLPPFDIPDVLVERPRETTRGDYATAVALQLARPARMAPLKIAEAIVAHLEPPDYLGEVSVAPPGFINFRLSDAWLQGLPEQILSAMEHFGRLDGERGRAQVECVSANPTGPITLGRTRGGVIGDTLHRVLEAAGYDVTLEYYYNDAGRQITLLGESVKVRYLQQLGRTAELLEDHYQGEYIADLAAELVAERGDSLVDLPAETFAEFARDRISSEQKETLVRIGLVFDVYFREQSLYETGAVWRALEEMQERGYVYEQDGAQWFRSTKYGDDKDRVVIRSNGEPTYFASDIGYVSEKFGRGFDELIYIWGADHHGTIARLKNAAQALGLDRDATNVLLIAWVHFVRDGVEVSMSKRTGEFVTLDELLAEVGVDAARWFFASRAPSTGIDFDIELAKKESSENPVYYVQYAHARISSILRKAADEGLKAADSLAGGLADDEVALGLAKDLLRLPDIVRDAAQERETQSITAYATELATTFHAFYRDRRVVDASDPVTSGYRLALVDATRVTLAAALGLLGISAPDSM
jgi:arginyl-tRNA synthetase